VAQGWLIASNGFGFRKATNYPFEREVVQDDIGGLNLGFPGQYYDAERGLWNNGFRDYNASLGRYLENDPLGLTGGINGYIYVEDDPLSGVDIFGLCDNQEDIKTFPVVTVTGNQENKAAIPTGPLPPPLWLMPASSPVKKFIDDMLSKQLVRKLSHGALKINKYDKLEPTPLAFGIGLFLYSEPLGGCSSDGKCADETPSQFPPSHHLPPPRH
jgi:RHS repeat-associated protein